MTINELIDKLKDKPQDYNVMAYIEAEVLEDYDYPVVFTTSEHATKIVRLVIE